MIFSSAYMQPGSSPALAPIYMQQWERLSAILPLAAWKGERGKLVVLEQEQQN